MRRRRIAKRELTPDVKYNSELVGRLINTLMRNGKKTVAQSIVYGAFDVIKNKKSVWNPWKCSCRLLKMSSRNWK
jgi:small subunit ribosomal protein S7